MPVRPKKPLDPLSLTHWTTRDGNQTPVECMDDEHIDNTIKMLCRSLEREWNPSRRTLASVQAFRRAWIERFTHELAERALGRKKWRKTLSYIMAKKIYNDAIASGLSHDEASMMVSASRHEGWVFSGESDEEDLLT